MEGLLAAGIGGDDEVDDDVAADDNDEFVDDGNSDDDDQEDEYVPENYEDEDEVEDEDEELHVMAPQRNVTKAKWNSDRPLKNSSINLKQKKAKQAVLAKIFEQPHQQQQQIDNRPLGVLVEEKQKVVGTHVFNCMRKPANVVCRVDAFKKTIEQLDPSRRKVVVEMGFGSLLNLKVNRLDRKFCYWLATRVNAETCTMLFGDGKELPLCPVQWKCVLGIPRGMEPVPLTCEQLDFTMQTKIKQVGGWFREFDKKGRAYLSVANAEKALFKKLNDEIGPLMDDVDVVHFRYAFLVVVLGQLLCPSTDGGNMSLSLLPAASVADEAEKYNWCDFCFDWLMTYLLKFRRKFLKDGYVAGHGGCSLFLVLFYMDHLDIIPNKWSEMPRIDVWTQDKVNAVIDADKRDSGDYGKLKCIDVAYGERHPRVARDRMIPPEYVGKSVEDAVVRRLMRELNPRLDELQTEVVEMVMNELKPCISKIEKLMQSRRKGRQGVATLSTAPSEKAIQAANADWGEGPEDNTWNGIDARDLDARRKGQGVSGTFSLDEFEVNNAGFNCDWMSGGDQRVTPFVESLKNIADIALLSDNDDQGSVHNSVQNQILDCEKVDKGDGGGGEAVDTVVAHIGGKENVLTKVLHDVDTGKSFVGQSAQPEGGEHDVRKNIEGENLHEKSADKGENPDTNIAQPNQESHGSDVGGGNQINADDGGGSKSTTTQSNQQMSASKRVLPEVTIPEKTRMLGNIERKVFTFVKNWSPRSDKSGGPTLIRCDGMDARVGDCHGVLGVRDWVSTAYVDMAAKLYTKEWAEEYKNKSKRVMVDVSFAVRLIDGTESPSKASKKYGKNLKGLSAKQLAVVFVPVVEKEHWWCAAFDFKDKTIHLIDSMYSEPDKQHNDQITKLAKGVDVLVRSQDKTWEDSTCGWRTHNIAIMDPRDNNSCGVIMLWCIKMCAYRFMNRFGVKDLRIAREGLLHDDLHHDLNELKESFDQIVGGS